MESEISVGPPVVSPSTTLRAGKVEPKVAANLRSWNISMGFLHLFQAIAMILLSTKFLLPINGNFLNFNIITQTLEPTVEKMFSVNIGLAVAGFLFLSAIAHFLVSTIFYKWYIDNLGKHINIARWVEYAFSSSLMLLIIAMLVGIYDIAALIMVIGLNASMILFGWMMELHNQTLRQSSHSSLSLRAHPSESKTGDPKSKWIISGLPPAPR
jgi:hypothetical protein